MADIFETSISGLLTYQRALATTSHNISNVNTDGYSRQRVDLAARTPSAYGNGFVGNGVEATTIRRAYDQARQEAVWRNTSDFKRLETFADYSGRIDDLLADQSAGLSPIMQDFFGAAQDLANDPSSSTARQAMLTQGENLVSRTRFMDDRLREIQTDVEQQLKVQVGEVSEMASAIADLNESIVAARGRTGGQPPNDLLDQRDELVRKLNEKVSAKVVEEGDGAINVFLGNGQALVSRFQANQLTIVNGVDDPQRPEIGLTGNGSTPVNITRNLSGGSLTALLDFRRQVLEPTRDDLGRVATSVAVSVNNQQNLGMQFDGGPDGALGADFFNLGDPEVISRTTNSGGVNPQPDVSLVSGQIDQLTGSNYRLGYDGTQWQMTRLSDNQVVASGSGPFQVDGLSVDVSSLTPGTGDSYLIRPTRQAAYDMSVALNRPSQIAAASPVRVEEATDSSGQATNGGNAQIDGLTFTGGNVPAAGSDITLEYQQAQGGFVVNGGPDVVAYDPSNPAQAAGLQTSLPAPYGGIEFTVSGTPDEGDSFVISRNTNAHGDNANALAMGNLPDQSLMDSGNATFQEAYSGLVGDVGTETLRAKVGRDAQQSVLDQATAAREEVAGVNLDEEAANLAKFQKAYQASAQAVSIANTLFDSLLAAVGR
jgi:flagellar hook-associated protein 1 FlgK